MRQHLHSEDKAKNHPTEEFILSFIGWYFLVVIIALFFIQTQMLESFNISITIAAF